MFENLHNSPCTKKRFCLVNLKKIPKGTKGIYGIWFKNWCIYIGKAKKQDLQGRLIQHWKGSHNDYLNAYIQSEAEYIYFCYKEVPKHSINSLESRLINLLQPITNKELKE